MNKTTLLIAFDPAHPVNNSEWGLAFDPSHSAPLCKVLAGESARGFA